MWILWVVLFVTILPVCGIFATIIDDLVWAPKRNLAKFEDKMDAVLTSALRSENDYTKFYFYELSSEPTASDLSLEGFSAIDYDKYWEYVHTRPYEYLENISNIEFIDEGTSEYAEFSRKYHFLMKVKYLDGQTAYIKLDILGRPDRVGNHTNEYSVSIYSVLVDK